MNKEDKIRLMERFIERHTTKEIAEFIVNLNDAVRGLNENMESFQKEFRELYMKEVKK